MINNFESMKLDYKSENEFLCKKEYLIQGFVLLANVLSKLNNSSDVSIGLTLTVCKTKEQYGSLIDDITINNNVEMNRFVFDFDWMIFQSTEILIWNKLNSKAGRNTR